MILTGNIMSAIDLPLFNKYLLLNETAEINAEDFIYLYEAVRNPKNHLFYYYYYYSVIVE